MDQSMSGASGKPSRMTLAMICSFCESSDMRESDQAQNRKSLLDRVSTGSGSDLVSDQMRYFYRLLTPMV